MISSLAFFSNPADVNMFVATLNCNTRGRCGSVTS
uniref:Uncharacterized protein n=1 Tax=Anguilla anguilla TaxID=7936 RepID=A0A0E9XPW8_ANGAN